MKGKLSKGARFILIIVLIVFVIGAAGTAAFFKIFGGMKGPRILGSIKRISYKKEVLSKAYGIDQDVKVKVFLPKQYDPSKAYPIIYLLDGDSLFKGAAGYLSEMIKENPKSSAILVGIGYGYVNSYFAPRGKGRWRDYTFREDKEFSSYAKGPEFYKFLSEMLVPDIEKKYKADKKKSTLIGHSCGGDFTYFAFLQYDTAKGDKNPFANFILGDGGDVKHFVDIHMPSFEKRMEANGNKTHQEISLYRIWGYLTNKEAIADQEELHKWLLSKKYSGIKAYRYYPMADDHGATMKTTILNGFKLVLEGEDSIKDYKDKDSYHFE